MTVKRYTPTQCCEHDGTYVTYSDYQKLVAENVAMRDAINGKESLRKKIRSAGMPPHGDYWHQSISEADERILKSVNETPATDAAIAEIKAQGVDEVVKFLSGLTSDECGDSAYIGAVKIAANLRAGRKG